MDDAAPLASALPPRTTAEQDRASYGQRRVNIIWEVTQAVIAMSVLGTTLYVSGSLAVRGGADMVTLGLLSNAFFLVIGFYFGRTNHARTGGIGGEQVTTNR